VELYFHSLLEGKAGGGGKNEDIDEGEWRMLIGLKHYGCKTM
jgi:hypothetical protein